MKLLLNAGLINGDCITITGQTIAEVLKDIPDTPSPDQHIIFSLDKALYKQGHLAILKSNLSPEGAVAKTTGDRQRVVEGKSVSVRVDRGGRRILKKKTTKKKSENDTQ